MSFALSTRAEITSTSFINTYHWGSFKGEPAKLMDRYFDAFVYVANRVTHRLMLRIPRRVLDVELVRQYCDGEVVSFTVRKDRVVLGFSSEDEEGDEWSEGRTGCLRWSRMWIWTRCGQRLLSLAGQAASGLREGGSEAALSVIRRDRGDSDGRGKADPRPVGLT